MLTRLGQLTVSHSTRGKATYSLELWHDGLKKHRLIRGEGEAIVRRKAQIQIDEWEAKWSISDGRHRGISDAATRTAEAQQELDRLSTILKHTLSIDDAIEWERLKDREPFSEPKPISGTLPSVPTVPQLPREPQMSDSPYAVSLGMLDKLFSSRRERLQAEKQDLFEADRKKWGEAVAKANHSHVEALRKHEQIVRAQGQKVQSSIEAWERRKSEHLVKQARNNAEVDQKQRAYEELMPEAVLEYCDLVLSLSQYPDYFPQEFEMEYDPSSKILLLDYVLPAPDQLPTLKAVKYVASTGGNEDQHITDAQASKLYDETLYQVVLRTIHELFEADTAHAVATVVFNGIVTAINRSTGNPVTACVLSLRTNREEFVNIDLGRVDPKACFKSLKGVGSSKLYGLSPIPPIMPLRREDGRFISSYEVANTLDASVNLAAMDWGDFEHLIREEIGRAHV